MSKARDTKEHTAVSRVEARQARYRGNAVHGFLFSLLQAVILCGLLFTVLLRPVRMEGQSMAPNLQPGQVLLFSRFSRYFGDPARGDLVLFFDDGVGCLAVRRVIGLPGERVEITDGRIYINSIPLTETGYTVNTAGVTDLSPVTVEPGCVFLLSDDRTYGGDSRERDLGSLPCTELLGTLRASFFPEDLTTIRIYPTRKR